MASKANLEVIIDYLSIVFENIYAEDVIHKILTVPIEFFRKEEKTYQYGDYQTLYKCGNISIWGDKSKIFENPKGTGAYLILPGSACRDLTQEHGIFVNMTKFLRKCQIHNHKKSII